MKTLLFTLFFTATTALLSQVWGQDNLDRIIDTADPRGPVPTERNRGSALTSSGGSQITSRSNQTDSTSTPRRATSEDLESAKAKAKIKEIVKKQDKLSADRKKAVEKDKPTSKLDQQLSDLEKELKSAVRSLR
jgi:hypothetical protein